MVAVGLAKIGTLPGEWYGPSKVSYVLRDLVQLHEKSCSSEKSLDNSIFRVRVAPQGCIYRDSVHDLMTTPSPNDSKESLQVPDDNLWHPLDPKCTRWGNDKAVIEESLEWDTALVILVPLRPRPDGLEGHGKLWAYRRRVEEISVKVERDHHVVRVTNEYNQRIRSHLLQ